MTAGRFDHIGEFYRRETVATDMGGTQDQWVMAFIDRAAVKYLRGGEGVMEARLASRNPVIIAVHNSEMTRQVTSEWRVVMRSSYGISKEYQLREDPRPAGEGKLLEALAEG